MTGSPDPSEIVENEYRVRMAAIRRASISHTDHIFAGWMTYDMPTVPVWRHNRMIVIGDAAHAVSPSAGQGASMAIEDAVILGKCLRGMPSVPGAFSRYEELRRHRVERVVSQGRRNGNGKTVGPVGRVLRDLFMPLVMRRRFRDGRDALRWIWDHHIDWDAPVADEGFTHG